MVPPSRRTIMELKVWNSIWQPYSPLMSRYTSALGHAYASNVRFPVQYIHYSCHKDSCNGRHAADKIPEPYGASSKASSEPTARVETGNGKTVGSIVRDSWESVRGIARALHFRRRQWYQYERKKIYSLIESGRKAWQDCCFWYMYKQVTFREHIHHSLQVTFDSSLVWPATKSPPKYYSHKPAT